MGRAARTSTSSNSSVNSIGLAVDQISAQVTQQLPDIFSLLSQQWTGTSQDRSYLQCAQFVGDGAAQASPSSPCAQRLPRPVVTSAPDCPQDSPGLYLNHATVLLEVTLFLDGQRVACCQVSARD